jgi:putative ABC transport system substrate-binding protein
MTLLVCFPCSAAQVDKQQITVAINQIVDHQALNDIRHGLEDTLNTEIPGRVKIKFDNANGSIPTSVQIAKMHAGLNPEFIVGISTPSAQAADRARNKDKTTLVAVAVTDFQAAGLDKATNMIGVSDQPQIEEMVSTLLMIMPNVKTIGAIYNSSEISSVKTVERLIKAAPGIKIKTASITSTRDIQMAAAKLAKSVDVIYTPLDNMVYSGIDSLISTANQAKIPVIGHDPTTLKKGIFMEIGADHYTLGVQAGNMIVDMANGKAVEPNVQVAQGSEIMINSKAAKLLGISIPQPLQKYVVNK